MNFIFTSYLFVPEFSDPQKWLQRIAPVAGIMESLAVENHVTSIERINFEGELVKGGVHYYFLKFRNRFIRFPRKIHRLVVAGKPDVVFINGMIFPWQLIRLRAWVGTAVKIIVLHRAEKPFTGFKKLLFKKADKGIDAYLFSAAEMGEQWVERGLISESAKIFEVMQASSCFHYQDRIQARSLTKMEGNPIYLWVGRLEKNKDPMTVVKAFAAFLEICPGASLYMIFQESILLDDVSAVVNRDEKTKKQVRLIGKIAYQELGNWYNSADFIISGSHYEGSGIAVCEAMSCGCIPVLTDILSFRKMTGPDACGLLFRAGDERDLLEKLKSTLSMDIEIEKKRTIDQFSHELSFEAIALKIHDVIHKIQGNS